MLASPPQHSKSAPRPANRGGGGGMDERYRGLALSWRTRGRSSETWLQATGLEELCRNGYNHEPFNRLRRVNATLEIPSRQLRNGVPLAPNPPCHFSHTLECLDGILAQFLPRHFHLGFSAGTQGHCNRPVDKVPNPRKLTLGNFDQRHSRTRWEGQGGSNSAAMPDLPESAMEIVESDPSGCVSALPSGPGHAWANRYEVPRA